MKSGEINRSLPEGTQALDRLRAFASTPAGYTAVSAGLALLYFAGAKFGLRLALVNPSATPVWPPTGIAFAAVLLLGYRIAPALFIGAFAANLTTSGGIVTSLVIAAGNVAEGLVGAFLVQRFAAGVRVFDRAGTIFRFLIFSALVSTTLSATAGVGVLTLGGYADPRDFGPIWLTWWLGDAVGDILVAPVLVLFLVERSGQSTAPWTPRKALEAAALAVSLVLAAWVLFGTPSLPSPSLRFLTIPFLLWAAFRFGKREAAVATLLLACAAIPATMGWSVRTQTATTGRQINELLLLLQGFLGVSGVTTLTVSAVVAEHLRLSRDLRSARDELAGKVEVTGLALAGVTAEAHLTAGLLSRAEQVARTGSFRWDVAAHSMTWSEQMHRIYGRGRAEFDGTFDGFLSCVHPDDRDDVRLAMESALRDRKGYRVKKRIIRPDGETRIVDSIGEVALGDAGQVTEVYGVSRDVTEEQAAETRFQSLLESAPDTMVVVNHDGVIIMVNAQAERITGYDRRDLVGQRVELLVPERFRARHPGHRDAFFASPSARPVGIGRELFVRRRDGSQFPAEISLSPVSTPAGVIVMAAIRDVTERRETEGSIRQLSRRLLQVQDEEQQRVARELQSGVVQTLDELRAQLSVIRDSGTVFDWRTSDALRRSLDLVREATKEIRTVSYLLYPRLLQESGLAEAIRYYQGNFQGRTGIKVVLDIPSSFERLSPEAERSLFRVVQEYLTDVYRRGNAAAAWIVLRSNSAGVTLEIRDDGPGTPAGAADPEREVWVRGLRERIGYLGGELDLESNGTSTRVMAFLPPG